MKKFIPFIVFMFATGVMMAQCNELFISEYVEGYANNKAVEIYNPTNQAVDLSQYSIARFSNGSPLAPDETQSPAYMVTLPAEMLEPFKTYVVVVDLRDTALWDSQFDKPVWNGYNLIDTLYDIVSGLPQMDSLGNILTGPQYSTDGNNNAIFGDVYNEEYDLQGKANVFLCPDYDTNRTTYWNGNDAVALIKSQSAQLPPMYADVVDVVGVIGEDPVETIDEPAWVDADGFWLTRDRTLVRKKEIKTGTPGANAYFQTGGTFDGAEWESYRKNDFSYLGGHTCDCESTATDNLNQVAFKMFPNPNRGEGIQLTAQEMITRVELHNLLGQTVSIQTTAPTNSLQVATNTFDKGVYIINVWFGDNQRSVKKLIIE